MKRTLLSLLSLSLALPVHAGDNAVEARKLKIAYAQRLDALLAKAKAAGDTADVKEIEGLIAEVEGKAAQKTDQGNTTFSRIVGRWRNESDNGLWEFVDTKSGNARGTPFTLTFDASKKEIYVHAKTGWSDVLTITGDTDILRGKGQSGNRYRLIRVKE